MDAAASQSTVGGAGRVRGGQGRPTARRTRRCWPAGAVQRSPLLARPGRLLRAYAAGWAARWLQVEQGGRVTGHLSPWISSRKAKYKAGEESMTVQKQSFSIKEFCRLHAMSRSFFYVLREGGEARSSAPYLAVVN